MTTKKNRKRNRPIRKISVHKPNKKNFYVNKNFFGHYLAGLIDGDGHFSKIGQLVISFSSKDVSLARTLRTQIGHGTVSQVKGKNAHNFIISNKAGIEIVSNLVRDKLKHPDKIKQFNERLVNKYSIKPTSENTILEWDTPWFSGFFDADGSWHLDILPRFKDGVFVRTEVRLLAKVDQKADILLRQIENKFSGNVWYREKQDTYAYSSVSYANFSEILQYFDKYSLQAPTKYLCYVYMRKAFLIVLVKNHLKSDGLKKIEAYCVKMSKIKV